MREVAILAMSHTPGIFWGKGRLKQRAARLVDQAYRAMKREVRPSSQN